MATLGLTGSGVCSGGGHITVAVTLNSVARGSFTYHLNEMQEPLSDQEIRDAIKVILRLRAIGLNANQIRNGLTSGINLTI